MEIPVERWYNAIYLRRSRRKFLNQPLAVKDLDHMGSFLTVINKSFQVVRAQLVTENPDQAFKGVVGSYGKIKGAGAYIAFIGQKGSPRVEELIGYMGEGVILEATSLGLGTCWVGGFFNDGVVSQQIPLKPGERIFALTPLGYVPKDYSFQEKLMVSLVKSSKRKDLEELTVGLDKGPQWMTTALELARLAPSAVNRQPWRFIIESNAIKVKVDTPQDTYHISKRLDCGIAMLHLEIGALYEGVKGFWEYLSPPDVARFKVSQ